MGGLCLSRVVPEGLGAEATETAGAEATETASRTTVSNGRWAIATPRQDLRGMGATGLVRGGAARAAMVYTRSATTARSGLPRQVVGAWG